ncbi:hypothetical protein Y032_0084g1737 [Ancylostoma ceylanicum]|uniref:Uncharacterized protein n=1 Tax=Ancylostoma ceylanicum TaxID=53326 RepID=A0A016TQW8_9BILA|nr:hypothetical protein Y032_0084g1737 [Ancylostoma ceylanicum]
MLSSAYSGKPSHSTGPCLQTFAVHCTGDSKAAAILLEEYSGFGRRCRRQRRPTVAAVAAVVGNSDRPSPLSSTLATDRRRCRRHRRPTVAAVVDTPSSIPIDDSGDDYADKVGFAFPNSF